MLLDARHEEVDEAGSHHGVSEGRDMRHECVGHHVVGVKVSTFMRSPSAGAGSLKGSIGRPRRGNLPRTDRLVMPSTRQLAACCRRRGRFGRPGPARAVGLVRLPDPVLLDEPGPRVSSIGVAWLCLVTCRVQLFAAPVRNPRLGESVAECRLVADFVTMTTAVTGGCTTHPAGPGPSPLWSCR